MQLPPLWLNNRFVLGIWESAVTASISAPLAAKDLIGELQWRGLLHQVTDLERASAAFAAGQTGAYIGFDPTADSLHVGSLLPIVTLLRLFLAGQRPVAIVGGGTGLIGDPSGKSAERRLQTDADVAGFVDAISAQLHGIFANARAKIEVVDNAEWLRGLSAIAFLRDIGKHFSVNALVQRDAVKQRLEAREQGISYTEFSYALLQAYDFVELYRRHGVVAQLGGSDQWGNIVSGIDLIDRLERQEDGQLPKGKPFGLTMPLITTKSGQKFGKTEAGTVWLSPLRTSPYQFYQFWLQADDDDALRYLRFYSLQPREQLEVIQAAQQAEPHKRAAQKALAAEMTALVHGSAQLQTVEAATAILFGGDPLGADDATLAALQQELPGAAVPAADNLVAVATLLVGEGRPFQSNGEARKALTAGAVAINGKKVADFAAMLSVDDLLPGPRALVRYGKKSWYLLDIVLP